MANPENVVIEIELDPAQLEQVLGEIAELRDSVTRCKKCRHRSPVVCDLTSI